MTRFAPASLALMVSAALIASACGQTRESAATQDPTTTTAAETADSGVPTAPPTTGVPTDLAVTVAYGSDATLEITNGELAEYAYASRENEEFLNTVLGGSVPPGFDQNVLTTMIIKDTLDRSLAEAGATLTDEDLDMASASMESQLVSYFPESADPAADAAALADSVPYVGLIVEAQARQAALARTLAENAEGADVPCARHILVETEQEADDIIARLEAGEDFAALAAENSKDPGSAADGGDLGCTDPQAFVPEFADAINNAEVGEIVGPVQTSFGFHIITVYEIGKETPDGNRLAVDAMMSQLQTATVDVDPALGTWDTNQLSVVPA